LRQAIDLKAAGVREQGPRPTDEAVQTANAPNGFVAGAQVEMVGVAENDFGTKRFEHILRNGFDRAGRAHGHEHWGFDGSVGEVELRAAPACGRCIEDVEG